jgi:hypothetical protein
MGAGDSDPELVEVAACGDAAFEKRKHPTKSVVRRTMEKRDRDFMRTPHLPGIPV